MAGKKPACPHFVARIFREILAGQLTHFIHKRFWRKRFWRKRFWRKRFWRKRP